jgi:hypothetical protein
VQFGHEEERFDTNSASGRRVNGFLIRVDEAHRKRGRCANQFGCERGGGWADESRQNRIERNFIIIG